MSNKDTSNEINHKKKSKLDLFQKEEMHLFSYELLKSKKNFMIFSTNSFKYEFEEEKKDFKYNKDNKESKMKINNRTISIIDEENNSSLKTLNIEVPSSERLSQNEFKNSFLKEYDTSFSNFCGISKSQYENIYIKNKYIPKIDNFGDIKINIKNIIEVLNEFPLVKIGKRNILGRKFKKLLYRSNKKYKNRFKFPFKTRLFKKSNKKKNLSKTNSIKTKSNNNSNIKKNNNIKLFNNNINNIQNNTSNNTQNNNNININNTTNNNNNNINMNKTNSINNIRKNNFGLTLKEKAKGLSIFIPKDKNSTPNSNKSILTKGNNQPFQNIKLPKNSFPYQIGNINVNKINKNYIPLPNIQNINPVTVNSILSNSRQHSNTDIFNFSNRDIINYLNFGNINRSNLLSPNILLTPLISPFPVSPYPSIFSANLNNNINPDGANYNNNFINGNSFIFPNNSPALINININNNFNLNNNVVNGNIMNNNSSGKINNIKNSTNS